MKNRIAEVLRKFAGKTDYLEIHIEETEESRVAFTGRRLSDIGRRVDLGGNVRALYKDAWGFASFNSLDRIEEFAGHAVDQARLVGTGTSRLARVEPVVDDVALDVGRDPRDVSLADKVDVMRAYNEQVLGFHDDIITSSVMYFDRFRRFWFGSSEGAMVYQERVDIGGRVAPVASRGGGSQSYSASFGGSDDFGVALGNEADVEEACRIALGKLDAPKVKAGEYTVVIDPRLGGVFIHEAFGHLSEGDNVYEDKNLQEVMVLGRRFGKPLLNVYDTGLDKGVRGYLVYDDEGVPTERTDLISEGELVGRLHSRETAGKMNERPTGNARLIDYRFPPVPRMRNTVIAPGDASFDEMIADVDLGIYAVSASGGQTNGEMFTFTAADARMIRNGALAEQVRDVMLTGNVFTTLENIDAVGDDLACHDGAGGCGKSGQFPLPVTHGAPHVRIRNVVIGGE